ncbi:hypothetical protein GCM10009658_34780 [Planotetraspora silvatica]
MRCHTPGPALPVIVMGNASMEVRRVAHRITTSNDDEGFANAVQRYVLPRG